ncbi:MAG: GPGG-motif small membrane protein [Actinomycetota bacterium]
MINFLLWIAAVILAVIGIVNLLSGAILWGIVLLVAAALIGPGGFSIARG